jgi:hypothetical protein
MRSNNTLREELMDLIHNVSPSETPILSTVQMVPVDSTYPQWLIDSYRAAATNAYLENTVFTDHSKTVPTRVSNIVQTMYRGGNVTDVQRAVAHAGMDDPLGYYEDKDVVEFKRDIELALVRGSAVTGTTDTASQLNGLMNVISTNTTNLSSVTMTETIYNNILALTWGNTARMPTDVYCGPNIKRTISGYTTNVTRNIDADEKRQINVVDFYDSEFIRNQRVHLHRDVTDTSTSAEFFAIDPSFVATGWLKPLRSELLARDGLRTRYQLSAHLTLLYNNEAAFCSATDVGEYIT